MKNKEYEISTLAALVPMASDAEQAALTQDIKENNLREPIVLWRGQVVDGRCRLKAWELIGWDAKNIPTKELDTNLSEDDVKIFVKSVNTRRNLTMTQKIISAVKELIDTKKASKDVSNSWGISKAILDNAKYIYKKRIDYIEPLFNGESVWIMNNKGEESQTNKVSAVYASIKREQEQIIEDTQHGWQEDTMIKTQAGKDWYYSMVENDDITMYRRLIAELANYKFNTDR